ncbi:MAG TPA: CoA transferase, partial [Burkholderiales bacterium]|nr:CoA transferase [Burkholderiales bacterium]
CDQVLGQPQLAIDPRYDNNTKRTAARAEVVAMIEKVFSAWPAVEVVAKLDAAGIANARLNTPDEVWNHPQLAARQRWREVQTPAGAIPALLPPASYSGVEARMDPVPKVGEHTDAILSGLGYSAAEIAQLRTAGTV